jgi:hypothetical protein
MDSATTPPAPGSAAYAHRDTKFVMNVHGRWEDPADDELCIGWARDFFNASAPFASSGVYVNFLTTVESRPAGSNGGGGDMNGSCQARCATRPVSCRVCLCMSMRATQSFFHKGPRHVSHQTGQPASEVSRTSPAAFVATIRQKGEITGWRATHATNPVRSDVITPQKSSLIASPACPKYTGRWLEVYNGRRRSMPSFS